MPAGRFRHCAVAASCAVALSVEFADELADGTKGAALPLIRGDLWLSYAQIGLLIGLPLLWGSLLELPLGLVAGQSRRHRSRWRYLDNIDHINRQ